VALSDATEKVTISVVSHGHGQMVVQLLEQLLIFPEVAQILLTLNIPEVLDLPSDIRIVVINNVSPRGFAANHNAAFALCENSFFCSLNPDIEFTANPFRPLLEALHSYRAALMVPLIVSDDGRVEDSLRRFPTPSSLWRKFLGGNGGRYNVNLEHRDFSPDWAAGMFLLFRSHDFELLEGFDRGFFLYYEDVDICARAWNAGMKIVACPSVSVIHKARRESHKNFQFLRWHLKSMARYFWKHLGRLPKVPTL
jgi:N-acetylglucosaminyl-diphospho-decaprenol L-rhamnosyltransferase